VKPTIPDIIIGGFRFGHNNSRAMVRRLNPICGAVTRAPAKFICWWPTKRTQTSIVDAEDWQKLLLLLPPH
jgi:hypothetical protein